MLYLWLWERASGASRAVQEVFHVSVPFPHWDALEYFIVYNAVSHGKIKFLYNRLRKDRAAMAF